MIGRAPGDIAPARRLVAIAALLALVAGRGVLAAELIVLTAESMRADALARPEPLPSGTISPALDGGTPGLAVHEASELLAVSVVTGALCSVHAVVSVDADALRRGVCPHLVFEPRSRRFMALAPFAAEHALPADATCAQALSVAGAFIHLDDVPVATCPDVPAASAGPPTLDTDGDGIDDHADEDDDDDGIPDLVERAHGLDPLDARDAHLDADRDGLDNLQEFRLATGISDADTDGDGLGDGAEVLAGRNPLVDERTAALLGVIPVLLD